MASQSSLLMQLPNSFSSLASCISLTRLFSSGTSLTFVACSAQNMAYISSTADSISIWTSLISLLFPRVSNFLKCRVILFENSDQISNLALGRSCTLKKLMKMLARKALSSSAGAAILSGISGKLLLFLSLMLQISLRAYSQTFPLSTRRMRLRRMSVNLGLARRMSETAWIWLAGTSVQSSRLMANLKVRSLSMKSNCMQSGTFSVLFQPDRLEQLYLPLSDSGAYSLIYRSNLISLSSLSLNRWLLALRLSSWQMLCGPSTRSGFWVQLLSLLYLHILSSSSRMWQNLRCSTSLKPACS